MIDHLSALEQVIANLLLRNQPKYISPSASFIVIGRVTIDFRQILNNINEISLT